MKLLVDAVIGDRIKKRRSLTTTAYIGTAFFFAGVNLPLHEPHNEESANFLNLRHIQARR